MYYKLELTMYYYCLWYDKLWGPSQRVVTLFKLANCLYSSSAILIAFLSFSLLSISFVLTSHRLVSDITLMLTTSCNC